MKEREVLLAAADLIEERGWCRTVYTENGRLCAAGALVAASAGGKFSVLNEWPKEAIRVVSDALGESIINWNDRKRSGRPVIAKLREIAAGLPE